MLFPKPDPGVKSGLVAAHDGDETERARAQSDWWLISPMVLVTAVFLLLGAGIGIGVGIGAATWNKESAKPVALATLASMPPPSPTPTDLDTCPANFQSHLTAVPILATCGGATDPTYTSVKPVGGQTICLQHLGGKEPLAKDTLAEIFWKAAPDSTANIIFPTTIGTWINPLSTACPLFMWVLAWIDGLYASQYGKPLPCNDYVQEYMKIEATIYEYEKATSLFPDGTAIGTAKYKWAFHPFYWPGMQRDSPATLPLDAPSNAMIATYANSLLNPNHTDAWKPDNAAYTFAVMSMGMMHVNFVVDDMAYQTNQAVPPPSWDVSMTYNGPDVPSCTLPVIFQGFGIVPGDLVHGFKKGDTVTAYGTQSSKVTGEKDSSLHLQWALFVCANTTDGADGKVPIPSFGANIYYDLIVAATAGTPAAANLRPRPNVQLSSAGLAGKAGGMAVRF
jgi:hypothetical protein